MASGESIPEKLLRLPCHFSWESLQNENVGRTVQMNIDNLEEHINEAIQGTQVESFNLMGFYKTQQGHFKEARANFEDALKYSETEDDKIVSLACMAWLTWKEPSSDSLSEEQVVEWINQVENILCGRTPEEIPEVMAEKAFAIANSGFSENGFKVALHSIDKALAKRSEDVMYKLTKATILQQLYHKKYKSKTKGDDDDDVQKIMQLWEELYASFETNCSYPVLHGQALIQYALFLKQINWDYGAKGKKYAEKAEKIARSNPPATTVMRNVARFYIQSAGNCSSQLDKAEAILGEILKSKPNGSYKVITNLAHCHHKKYQINSCAATFAKAEECFRKAWGLNVKYSIPALDLVRLYQMKYNKTKDVSALAKAEKIFRAIFLDYERKENLEKAMICSGFGGFLKGYGSEIASSYHQKSLSYPQGDQVKSPKIEQALQLIHQYTQDKQDEHILQAEKSFRQLYNSWEELRDEVKARFCEEFAAFLDDYSNDLAFCYLTKSLSLNPHQGYAYEPLEELARHKIASGDKREQFKGYKSLQMIARLQRSGGLTEMATNLALTSVVRHAPKTVKY